MIYYSLDAQNLSASFSKYPLFSNVNFSIKSTELLKIIGANSSGKTTLLRIIAGLSLPLDGKLQWRSEGHLLSPSIESTFVSVNPPLKNNFRVFEQLHFWRLLRGILPSQSPSNLTKELERILGHFGLQDLWDTPIRYLSAGQRQSLNLCQLFLKEIPLWILDEPFAHLDARQVDRLSQAMALHLSNQGLIIIASPHDLPSVEGQLLHLEDFKPVQSIHEDTKW